MIIRLNFSEQLGLKVTQIKGLNPDPKHAAVNRKIDLGLMSMGKDETGGWVGVEGTDSNAVVASVASICSYSKCKITCLCSNNEQITVTSGI